MGPPMQETQRPVIGFLTDFGLDGAAATCRGVMLSICRDAQIVDITHGIRRYASQVAVPKDVMIPRDADGRLLSPTPFLDDAHAAGLSVAGWTFRRENRYLPAQLRRGAAAL